MPAPLVFVLAARLPLSDASAERSQQRLVSSRSQERLGETGIARDPSPIRV